MIDNEDYNVRLAKYIWTILTSHPIILMSWGIDPKTVKTIELGLEFHSIADLHSATPDRAERSI